MPTDLEDFNAPLTAGGTPLIVGQVYELTEDYRPRSQSKNKKAKLKVRHPKGTRFVPTFTDHQLCVNEVYGSNAEYWPDMASGAFADLLSKLKATTHDGLSLLWLSDVPWNYRGLEAWRDVLAQLLVSGSVTIEAIRAAVEIDTAHEKALDDDRRWRRQHEDEITEAVTTEGEVTNDA